MGQSVPMITLSKTMVLALSTTDSVTLELKHCQQPEDSQ